MPGAAPRFPVTHFTVNTAEIRKALTRRETGHFSSTLVRDSRPYPLRACSMSVSSFTTCGRHFGQYVLIMSISSDNEHYNAGLICFCESRLFLFPARGDQYTPYTVRWHAVHDALGPSGRAHEAGTRLHACFFRLLTEQDSSRTTASKTKPGRYVTQLRRNVSTAPEGPPLLRALQASTGQVRNEASGCNIRCH